jgi:hypothetical protein
MNRISILGSNKSGPKLPWDVQVGNAVHAGDHEALLVLIGKPGGRRRLREGFTIGGQSGVPFARLCLRAGAIDALRAVIAAAPDGVTLSDACVHHVIDERLGRELALEVYSEMSLHEEALADDGPYPEALAFALDHAPDHFSVTGHLDRFGGATLHYQALYKASTSGDVERVGRFAECCRLLIAHGAPIEHKSPASSSLSEMLFLYRWNRDGIQDVMVPLIGDYVRAGLIELDASPTPGGINLPVIRAILAGNGYPAAAAIDLGCDVELAMRAIRTEGFHDLLDVARSGATDTVGQTVALVTEALMRRRLGAPAVRSQHCILLGDDARAAFPRARARREGL